MSIVQSAGGSNQHNATGIVRPIYSAVVSTVVLVRVRVPVSALLVQTGYSLGTIFAIYFLSPDYHFFATSREAATGRFRRAHASIREHAESIAFSGGGLFEQRHADALMEPTFAISRRQFRQNM